MYTLVKSESLKKHASGTLQCNGLISCMFAGKQRVGIWTVTLVPIMFGGPYRLEAHSMVDSVMTTITLDDIMFGDVWICSGQSNMEFTVISVS